MKSPDTFIKTAGFSLLVKIIKFHHELVIKSIDVILPVTMFENKLFFLCLLSVNYCCILP